ncbi:Transposase and inactivated derivatives, IS30 family [Lysinibacillus sphaericus]|nr:Transposase and inactivated derivatives, IS30 family [Lysinibacillus sphaericus]
MSYAHILPRERVLIEEYIIAGMSLSYIAQQLKRSKSTIHYELGRIQPYNALQAQVDYDSKRKNCGCKRLVNLDDVTHILVQLKKGWSPEMIIGRYEKKAGKPFSISVSSIFRYAAEGLFQRSQKLFIRKGKKLKNNVEETRGKMPQLKKIHAMQAPRTEIGHWEVDTVIGKGHKSQILTLTEWMSRFTIVQKLSSKTAGETAKEIIYLM